LTPTRPRAAGTGPAALDTLVDDAVDLVSRSRAAWT
jgi:hypothetical protein